jgi:hypothetical protein
LSRQLGVLVVVLGSVAAIWDIWHVITGRTLPGLLGYRYRRARLYENSLRVYSSLQLVGAIGVIVLGVGLDVGAIPLIMIGVSGLAFSLAVDIAFFAFRCRRKD